MKRSVYHEQLVRIESVTGDADTVHRYLRKCKHCVGWDGQDGDRHAKCNRLNVQTGSEVTSCDKFLATEDGFNTIWLESEARIGDNFVRIIYKGKSYFVERDGFVKLMGYDPDQMK